MADAGGPRRSWIPDGRDDVDEDWVRSLLASHFGDGVTVEQFRVVESGQPVDHCRELQVEFDCSFDAPVSRQATPSPLAAMLQDSLVFTACVEAEEEKDAPLPADNAVIQELESVTLPEGAAAGIADEDIELLVTSEEVDGTVTEGRRPSFYISDSDEEAEAPLPTLVSYPASGGPSPRAPSPADSESDDQTPDKHFIWTVRLPTSNPLGDLLSDAGLALDREMTLFSLVAPRVAGLSIPSCVYCEQDCGDPSRWVLVTEDPRRQSSSGLDPRKALDSSSAAPIVDALATNAALFLLLRRQLETTGNHISDEFKALRPSDLELGRHPLAEDHAGQCLRELAEIIHPLRPDLSKWLLSKAPNAMDAFLRLSEPDEDLGIPVNGMCCPQNLHLGDEGVVMFDWHLFRYAGLTFDLAHLLLTAVPLESRRQMVDSLLQNFTRRIREKFEEWEESPVSALTDERVRRDFEQSRASAFFWAATDLCRRLGRMPSHPSAKQRGNDERHVENMDTTDVNHTESVASARGDVDDVKGNSRERQTLELPARMNNAEASVGRTTLVSDHNCPGAHASSAKPRSAVDRSSGTEGQKQCVENDGCGTDDSELQLRDVLIQRLLDMVVEIKDLNIL